MKRFHVHLGVANLEQSIRFYSGLFGVQPTVRKDDYAKWLIEDPRVNFAISHRGGKVGVNHLGLQAESAEELADIRVRFAAAGDAVQDDPDASCCYARSDKHWVADPQGMAWEGYHTMGEIRYFDRDASDAVQSAACCGSDAFIEAACCASTKPAGTKATGGIACCVPAAHLTASGA